VGTAPVRVAQEQDREHGIDEPHVFHRVACFLTALTARRLSRILGTRDAPFGPIVSKRGEAGAGSTAVGRSDVGGNASVGSTRAAASASAIPRRLANSAKERVGASPNARSAARRTTKRTWIH
jgi:hypothetical protein